LPVVQVESLSAEVSKAGADMHKAVRQLDERQSEMDKGWEKRR
jgi:hypothetical protein